MPLAESQRTLISEHPLHPTSSKNEDGRVLGPAPHKSQKHQKHTQKKHLFSPACYACFISIVY